MGSYRHIRAIFSGATQSSSDLKGAAKRYDVFISYRKEYGGLAKDDIGCAIARNLAQALEAEGYSVFFDCDRSPFPTFDEASAAMRRARTICILLSDYFFKNLDPTSGYAQELHTAEAIYRQDKERVVFLNINGTFHISSVEGTAYAWLSKINYKRFQTARDFRKYFEEFLPAVGLKRLPVNRRIRLLRLLLLLVVAVMAAGWYYDSHVRNRLFFTGGGTVKNFLIKEMHVNVDKYDYGGCYQHQPSLPAAVLLAEEAKHEGDLSKKRDWKGHYEYVILSTGQIDTSKFFRILSSKEFKNRYRILEYKLGYAVAQVVIYPEDPNCKDTISLSKLKDLMADPSTFVITTDEQSGTYATYATLLPGFDSLMARKRAKGAIEEFTPQSPEDFLTTKLDKDWSRVVVLQNNYYNIFDEAGVNGRDSAYEAAVIDSVRDTVRLPLYVYMVVEKGEDDRFYIKANSLKGRFLRKVGYEFSSKSQNLCSWMDEDLIK